MIIPTWLIVVGCILLYALIGVVQTVAMAYRAGRRGRGGIDGPEGIGLMIAWPVCNIVMLVLYVVDMYDDFLRAVRDRGAQSVMPPENEHQSRRIDR